MAKVGNFTKETLKNGAKVIGGHRVKYVSEDKEFIILLTSYGYYYGLFLTYESDGAHIDGERTPRQSQEHCFNTLDECKKFWKVGEYADVQEPESDDDNELAVDERIIDLKSKHPEAIILNRKGDIYECYNEDAEVVSEVIGISITQKGSTKLAMFPAHAIDTYLPKLIRAGKKVCLCDVLEPKEIVTPKEVTEKNPKTISIANPIESRSMETMREQFVWLCDTHKIDIDKTCIKQSKEDPSHGTLVGYKDKVVVVDVSWHRKEEGKEKKYYIA